MENGSHSRNHRLSDCLPSVPDYIHAIKVADSLSSQCSDIVDHLDLDIVLTPKIVVKEVEDLSHELNVYQMLARTIGTTADGVSLRHELLRRRQHACEAVLSTTAQLSSSFKKTGIPKREMGDLERSCQVLVACLHALDRELRRTFHLYRLFPLHPDQDGVKSSHLINVGLSEIYEAKNKRAPPVLASNPAEKYLKERESWQDLECEILKVHDLDVDLHRNEILGPVLDYLTLCPMAGEIPGSNISIDDASDVPDGYCDQETFFRKKSNLICYLVSIFIVFCIGGGLLIAFIFMMVQ